MQLSVLVIDLVGYSERLAALEEQVSNAGATLNQQIEEFVSAAILKARMELKDSILKFTGDGAILKAPDAERAHRIAMALQEASAEFNRSKQTALGKRVFRVGIATGTVMSYESASGNTDHGGSTIGRAARMEAGCKPGSVMIDEPSFQALPSDLRTLYSGPETLIDKNKAEYVAYRLTGACLSRLQQALKKRLEEQALDDNSFEAALLTQMQFPKGIASLLEWIALPGHSPAYAIEKLRDEVFKVSNKVPANARAKQLVMLLFLVCAEQSLCADLAKASNAGNELKIALSDASVCNLIAAAMKNCGLHFDIDEAKHAILPKNIISNLPISEPGQSLESAVFEEINETERRLRRLHPTENRGDIKLNKAAMQARLRVLDESENIQIVLAFSPNTGIASDAQILELLRDLGVPSFHYGVPAEEATVELITAQSVGESLKTQLANLLESLAPSLVAHENPVAQVAPQPATATPAVPARTSSRKPLVFLSYARHTDDARYKVLMERQLMGLVQMGLIELFVDDRNILSGQYWNTEIRTSLEQAHAAVLMLSPHFLASDFIMQQELPVLKRLAPYQRLIPVVVSECVWQVGDLSALQVPFNGEPLQRLSDLELNSATVKIAMHLAKLCRP